MKRRNSFAIAAIAAVALGCADTNAPPPEPLEVLLAVNSTANTLSIVPVDAPDSAVRCPWEGPRRPRPVSPPARESPSCRWGSMTPWRSWIC